MLGFAGSFTVRAVDFPEVADWVEHTKLHSTLVQSALVVLKVMRTTTATGDLVSVVLVGQKEGSHTIRLSRNATALIKVKPSFAGYFVCSGSGLSHAKPDGSLSSFLITVYERYKRCIIMC